MFPREWRLTKKRDLQRVYQKGNRGSTRFLLIRLLENRLAHPRIAVIIGKKVAKRAVIRNRLKRLIRQAIRELIEENVATRLQSADAIVTIHHDPGAPYELAAVKAEVVQCLSKFR